MGLGIIGRMQTPVKSKDQATNQPERTPKFMVGAVPVFGRLILSPMDGYSDWPFRGLARQLGSAMSYTGFVGAIDVLAGSSHVDPIVAFDEAERPVAIQIFDNNPQRLFEAALRMCERNPDIIDVNMGCSAPGVSARGAGAGLMRDPAKIASIFSLLSQGLDVPVTGKIRLGWDETTRNSVEIAKIVEANGGKLIAVHGRTRVQGYTGRADWDAIAAVKRAVNIPVIANGDVRTMADVAAIRERTGCDGVMIGRAAMENPWIFCGLDREEAPAALVYQTAIHHLERMQAFWGPEKGLVFFRKFAARYIKAYGVSTDVRQALLTCTDTDEFRRRLQGIVFERLPEP
jgi:tRNA-dihydrouridine synthase B